jgi:hypothetical protein
MIDRAPPKRSCDETLFAASFYNLKHVMPFAKAAGR